MNNLTEAKEITVFSEGNALQAEVWSNIPFFLIRTLQKKGYRVNIIDVYGNRFFRMLYDRIFCRILRHTLMPHTTFSYQRSLLYRLDNQRIMRKAAARYPDTACYLSTSFSFAPVGLTDKPCVLFCDWTYDYYFHHFLKRKPDFLEIPEVRRQNALIEQADQVFVLFPDIADYMRSFYKNEQIHYLGNVINSEEVLKPVSPETKYQAFHILFIGLPKYRAGALSLIVAIELLQKKYPELTLDIIGMKESDLADSGVLPAFVTCHGYLSKDIPSEKEIYDTLLQKASLYVNTTPLWAGFSSALEALYHAIPVITTPYQSFVETFGDTIEFGRYCDSNEPDRIAESILSVCTLPLEDYLQLCKKAQESVLSFTWDAYVDKMLSYIFPTTI